MPIYHKTPSSIVGNHNTAEIDYHTSEAAKVKRTREQAYFNSYDFDAIEVLPYEDEEDEDEERRRHKRDRDRALVSNSQIKKPSKQTPQLTTTHHNHQHQHHQQQEQLQRQKTSNHSFSAGSSSSNSNHHQQHHHQHQQQQQQPLHHVNSKYNPSMYLQRITGIFAAKTNNQHHHLQQHHANGVGSVGVGGVNNDIALAVNARSHDNKHLKLSSSETSSTSLSSSSIAEEILNVVNVGNEAVNVDVVGSGVIATGSGLGNRAAPLDCARDVIGTTSTRTLTEVNSVPAVTTASVAAAAASSTAAGSNGGNFLLPRAMLKYQSSTLATQAGATGITAANTNSMPLATNSSPQNSSKLQQQQQQKNLQPARDAHNLDGIKGNTNTTTITTTSTMMPMNGSNAGLRLKKTSTSSSAITSLASEDIDEDREAEENGQLKKEDKIVVPKTINPKASARASSHQSHYSTDKSASSGYYSSNVCSTYSLEEHIYSEPTIDLKKLRNHAKESQTPLPLSSTTTAAAAAATSTPSSATTLQTNSKLQQHQHTLASETNSVMRSLDFNTRYRYAENDLSGTNHNSQTLPSQRNSQEFNDSLKILESSIENLDRHLKSFPGGSSQEALVSYSQNPYNAYASVNHNDKLRSSSSYHQLPTIQESLDAVKKPGWPEDRSDDSLMDIDLDSFLLDKDKKLDHTSKGGALANKGLDNPTFLTEEQEENHYKCAKYINSCPEDAYRVESDIHAPARSSISGQSVAVSVDLYPKRYEEQLHFQNTRELLEDVRDKIRLLTQTQEAEKQQQQQQQLVASHAEDKEEYIPKELHSMINTLKQELELYLERMNQHSELEIRQLCTGLVKNQHIVKMKNAFERRRSLTEAPDIYSTYEAIQDGIVMNAQGVPISIRQQITSIRCSSDPNFKMKRKSITEVFPMAECYVETVPMQKTQPSTSTTQMQRNLSYHKPVLEQLHPQNTNSSLKGNTSSGSGSGGDSSEPNDKESILDWHRKKPSIWEMYYGTNRIQQSLLGGKKNGMMVTTAIASSPSTMCYPSSRPESDFTLDLPRAEQLRIKMEKEKKFRQRCRVITTFLSLVFFLLTVMVVSLVLTRGKRMFGSMI